MASIFDLFKTSDNDKFSDYINVVDNAINNLSRKKVVKTNNQDNQVEQALEISKIFHDNIKSDSKKKYRIDKQNDDSSLSNLFKDFSISQDRIERYRIYDSLFYDVPLIRKILSVYRNNICLNNNINNRFILYRKTNLGKANKSECDFYEKATDNIIKYFSFDIKLKEYVIPNVLKYGDFFIELINLDEVDIKFNEFSSNFKNQKKNNNDNLKLVSESLDNLNNVHDICDIDENDIDIVLDSIINFSDFPIISNNTTRNNSEKKLIVENSNSKNYKSEFNDVKANEDFDISDKKNDDKNEKKSEDKSKIKNDKKDVFNEINRITLKFHKPHNIVPIITPYDAILGYLEFSEMNISQTRGNLSTVANPLITFNNTIESMSRNIRDSNSGGFERDDILKNFVKKFVDKVFKKYNLENYSNDEIKEKIEPDVFYIIKKIILSVNEDKLFFNNKKLNVRFLKYENVIHYKIDVGDYYPLGTSKIAGLIQPARLYNLTQLTNTITKVSRAAPIRKFTLETGSRDNISEMMEGFKRSFRNSKISINDLTTNTTKDKDIANIISEFKDMLVVKKKGVPYLDMEVQQSGDPTIGVRDLEDLRNEIVALSGIPPSFLGFDASELRENLVQTNIQFATDISNIQQMFNACNTKLISRICEIVFENKKDLSDFLVISFVPPTVLMLQLIESSTTSIGNIQSILMNMQDPTVKMNPMYLLKEYSPYINWDDFITNAYENELETKVNKPATPPDASAGM